MELSGEVRVVEALPHEQIHCFARNAPLLRPSTQLLLEMSCVRVKPTGIIGTIHARQPAQPEPTKV
jgi:hypothetical protein